MSNLKEIRTRLASIKSTMQITNAMKMVSAAKLRRAQDAIIQMRPYADKLHEILENISAMIDTEHGNPFGDEREINRVLLVVITSNKGLCGAFNANVNKKVTELIESKYQKQFKSDNIDFISIGKKGADFLRSKKLKIKATHQDLFDQLTFDNILPIVNEIMNDFIHGKYDVVELVYNQFMNAAVQVLINEQFLPVVPKEKEEDRYETKVDFILEPSKELIIDELIPKSLRIVFYKSLLDSFASEHGARMTAMHKATDNASDLIKELQLHYNKARQASITNEILEIVSGAEALKG
ncbi:MAG: ATP synthase F1 subunit gamma [Bacteroidales bacterium]|nr:ATP synthase F1 subunit gamma [Bacteroidales bacterium]